MVLPVECQFFTVIVPCLCYYFICIVDMSLHSFIFFSDIVLCRLNVQFLCLLLDEVIVFCDTPLCCVLVSACVQYVLMGSMLSLLLSKAAAIHGLSCPAGI